MKRHETLKCILIIMLVGILVISLAACQMRSKDEGNKTAVQELKNPNIRLLTVGYNETMAEAIEQFEAKHGGEVTHDRVPFGERDQLLITSIAAGNSYDLTTWSGIQFPKWIIQELIQPIDPYFDLSDSLWNKDIMDQYKYKGKYYSVYAGQHGFDMLYFNKGMFENNGLKTPRQYYDEGKWNYENFMKSARALTQDTNRDGTTDQFGFFGLGMFQQVILRSNNTTGIRANEDGSFELALDDPAVIEALQFYQDAYRIAANGARQPDFAIGKVAMLVGNTGLPEQLKLNESNMEWDFAPFPAGPNNPKHVIPGPVNMWGIITGAKNPQGAAEWITIFFNLSKENEELERQGDMFTAEQVRFYNEIVNKHTIILDNSRGFGAINGQWNQLFDELRKGMPVVSSIEQYRNILQNEIDFTMKLTKQ